MSGTGNRGDSLLHLLCHWRDGHQIIAGLAVFPPAPAVPTRLIGDVCGQDGCTSLIVGASDAQFTERLADHRKRCHG